MKINRKSIQISFFLAVLFLLFSFPAMAELPEVGKLKPILEVEGVTSGNFGSGKVVGPESFDVVGDDIYVLSSEDKELLHYKKYELIERHDLSDMMMYPTLVKVKNNKLYIVEKHGKLFVLDNAGNKIYEELFGNLPDGESVTTLDIKFDDYQRPLVLKQDYTMIGFENEDNENSTGELFYENSYEHKYKIEGNRVVCTEDDFSFKIKPRGGGFIYAELKYIDENDNLYIKVREEQINNIRKYNSRGELVAIGKLPSDKNKMVHTPTRARDVIVKGSNEIYALANYEDKTVIYEVELGQKLSEITEIEENQ